jgi:hypothetical protein
VRTVPLSLLAVALLAGCSSMPASSLYWHDADTTTQLGSAYRFYSGNPTCYYRDASYKLELTLLYADGGHRSADVSLGDTNANTLDHATASTCVGFYAEQAGTYIVTAIAKDGACHWKAVQTFDFGAAAVRVATLNLTKICI